MRLKILVMDSKWDDYFCETILSHAVYDFKSIREMDKAKNFIDKNKCDGVIVEWIPNHEDLLDYIKLTCPNLIRIVVAISSRIAAEQKQNYSKELKEDFSEILKDDFDIDYLLVRDEGTGIKEKIFNSIEKYVIRRYRKVKCGKFSGGNMTTNISNSVVSTGNGPAVGKIGGYAQVSFGDYAQFIQSITPQSSKEDILKILTFVKQELEKLKVSADVKEDITDKIAEAEIQVKKDRPNKEKAAEKLKTATGILEGIKTTAMEAVSLGNMIGKAIEWCGEQWIQWG